MTELLIALAFYMGLMPSARGTIFVQAQDGNLNPIQAEVISTCAMAGYSRQIVQGYKQINTSFVDRCHIEVIIPTKIDCFDFAGIGLGYTTATTP